METILSWVQNYVMETNFAQPNVHLNQVLFVILQENVSLNAEMDFFEQTKHVMTETLRMNMGVLKTVWGQLQGLLALKMTLK